MEYIILIYLMVVTFAQFGVGYIFTGYAARQLPGSTSFDSSAPWLIPVYWLVGLLLHLSGVFLLKSVGLGWAISVVFPFVVLLLGYQSLGAAIRMLKGAAKYVLNIPFLIWFLAQLYFGFSLFFVEDGIRTQWMNNYGDLTFHLGMITHFVGQGDFPPTYHILAGEPLSYPFYVNLWAAIGWLPMQSWTALSLVFMWQWILVWSLIFVGLTAGKGRVLPWLLLLGGGTFLAMVVKPDTYSWRLINEGFPWTTWLSTVWVTQRSAMMGAAICVTAVGLTINLANRKGHDHPVHLFLAGVLLGLSPLVHTHYFLVTTLFLGGYLFIGACQAVFSQETSIKDLGFKGVLAVGNVQRFLVLFFPTCMCLVFFPLLLGKSGMTGFMLGWVVPAKEVGLVSLSSSAALWLSNASPWLLGMGFVWWLTRAHVAMVLIVALFVLGNVVKLATWEWDQLKFFIAVFTIFLLVWRSGLNQKISRASHVLHWALVVALIIPGANEAFRVIRENAKYQVYTPQKLVLAGLIRAHTPKDAIIASPDNHNSAATLSGRSLFWGYPGTLASHSLSYQNREPVQRSIPFMAQCVNAAQIDTRLCPTHVVWDGEARKYWHLVFPPAGFTKVKTTADGQYTLYSVDTISKLNKEEK